MMKRQELYRRINTAIETAIPDVISKIDLSSITMPERPDSILTRPRWQSLLRVSVSFIFVIGIAILGIQLAFLFQPTNTHPLETETDILGFQAVAAISLIDQEPLEELAYHPLSLTSVTTPDITETELDRINDYLNMMEIALGDPSSSVESVTSDRSEYPFCLRIERQDLLANTHQITIYYLRESKETGTTFHGIVIENDAEYDFTASMGQTELAIPPVFRLVIDEANAITITDNSDESGQKFAFQTLRSGEESDQVEIALEASGKNMKATMKLTMSQKQIALKIEKNQDNNGFKVEYETQALSQKRQGTIDIQVVYDEDHHNYRYQYTIKSRQGDDQPEYQGHRKRGRETTSTAPIPTTENSTSVSTELPITHEPTSPGPGSSRSDDPGHFGSSPGPGSGSSKRRSVLMDPSI